VAPRESSGASGGSPAGSLNDTAPQRDDNRSLHRAAGRRRHARRGHAYAGRLREL